MADRIHPESINTLRQLIKLHGAEALIKVIREISAEKKD